MKKVRIVLTTLAALILACIIFTAFTTTYTRNCSGKYSAVCNLTTEDKKWVYDKFSHCQSIEELLTEINHEICNNYTYVNKNYFLNLQYFDFSEFVESKEGLCFDFSCFTKNVCLCISELKNWDIEVYVYDVILKNGGRHSYNFISYTDKDGTEIRYCTDMTDNLYRQTNNEEYRVFYLLGNYSFEEFAKDIFNDFIINKH